MERLTGIEIRVCEEATELGSPYERELVGEQASKWLSANVGSWVETEHPGAWNHDVCMAVLAAMHDYRGTPCPNRECEGCQATERGIVKVLALLPERYQNAVLQGFEMSAVVADLLRGTRS